MPDRWPPLLDDSAAADLREEYAPFVPTMWRQAVDLIREACRTG